jgi:flavin-binding protein dodecin
LGLADGARPVAYALWQRYLRFDPEDPIGRTAAAPRFPFAVCSSRRPAGWSRLSAHEEEAMPGKTFKIIELCGVSDKSYAEATKNAVAKASETLRNLDWFEVVNQRGFIKNGKVAEFQVVLKVGFRLESAKAGS